MGKALPLDRTPITHFACVPDRSTPQRGPDLSCFFPKEKKIRIGEISTCGSVVPVWDEVQEGVALVVLPIHAVELCPGMVKIRINLLDHHLHGYPGSHRRWQCRWRRLGFDLPHSYQSNRGVSRIATQTHQSCQRSLAPLSPSST